ncbi:hypothetical protein FNJ87_04550 [Nonlabens mediterrranea]|uniref:PglD N-terminal domain-containing protein n=1 Tax=Nonlabens mediterrranea TaxID=1419947 RepID=A0ABS0A2P1_9FLAO|nr:hypothetical protein [Nonlabens mediterrranea]
MDKLLIIGTGNYAELATYYLKKSFLILGYAEESSYRKSNHFNGYSIIDFENIPKLYKPDGIKILVAVGPNQVNTVRERLYNEVKQMGFECISYIDSSAYVWDKKAVGENSFIFPGVIIEPFATVGNNCVMWSGSQLSHHSSLQDHSFMAPHAVVSGKTIIKNNCFLGINSTVRDNLIIESHCIIGSGASIKKSTVTNGVYSDKGTQLYNRDSKITKV